MMGKIQWKVVIFNHVAYDRDRCQAFVKNVMNFCVLKVAGNFLTRSMSISVLSRILIPKIRILFHSSIFWKTYAEEKLLRFVNVISKTRLQKDLLEAMQHRFDFPLP